MQGDRLPETLQEANQIAEAASERTRLAITAWAISRIALQLEEPATYRVVVHERLGFRRRSVAYELLLPLLDILNRISDPSD